MADPRTPHPAMTRVRAEGGPSAPAAPRPRAEQDRRELDVQRFEQPDDVTCGPTCLMQLYRFFKDDRSFEEIHRATPMNPDGGTLAVFLGLTALRQGYRAVMYSFDLRVFDPSWFDLPQRAIAKKLADRAGATTDPRVARASDAWRTFIDEGGRVEFAELSPDLLVDALDRGHPVLSGLSATWLYRQTRERPSDNEWDDLRGEPAGHFVVICGYSGSGRRFMVRDPSSHVPFSKDGRYVVPAQRLINAILLGDVTQDAVLLEIWPRKRKP
jgi:hypothetical protein